jgi:hypothetical protein
LCATGGIRLQLLVIKLRPQVLHGVNILSYHYRELLVTLQP